MSIGSSCDDHCINRRVLDRLEAISHRKLSASHDAATLGSFSHQISYRYHPDTTDRSQVAEVGLAHPAHAQKRHANRVFCNHTNFLFKLCPPEHCCSHLTNATKQPAPWITGYRLLVA